MLSPITNFKSAWFVSSFLILKLSIPREYHVPVCGYTVSLELWNENTWWGNLQHYLWDVKQSFVPGKKIIELYYYCSWNFAKVAHILDFFKKREVKEDWNCWWFWWPLYKENIRIVLLLADNPILNSTT